MLSAVWLLLGSLTYSLQLAPGSFPKALTAQEEAHYLALAGQGDLEARNVLIERNLRLVAHITKKYFSQTGDQEALTDYQLRNYALYDRGPGGPDLHRDHRPYQGHFYLPQRQGGPAGYLLRQVY